MECTASISCQVLEEIDLSLFVAPLFSASTLSAYEFYLDRDCLFETSFDKLAQGRKRTSHLPRHQQSRRFANMNFLKVDQIELPAAFDAHVHLRDGEMAELVTPAVRRGGVNQVYVMVGCIYYPRKIPILVCYYQTSFEAIVSLFRVRYADRTDSLISSLPSRPFSNVWNTATVCRLSNHMSSSL